MAHIKYSIIRNFLTRCCWLYLISLTLPACRQKITDTGNYSDEFLKIQEKTDKIWEKNKSAEGLKYLDSAYRSLPSPTLNDRFRFYGYKYVYYQKITNNYRKALLYADSMLAVAGEDINSRQYPMNFAEANFARGDSYFELKQYSEAYQSYYQGYLTGKNYVNAEASGDYTYRMGMIMYKKGHYRLAASYFKNSYSSIKNSGNSFAIFYRRQELLDNIALSYRHNNQVDSATAYFDQALKFINDNSSAFPDKKLHLEMARGVVYGNKADIFIKNKKNEAAIGLLKKSIAINLQKGYNNFDAELTEIKLGQLYLDTRQDNLLVKLLTQLRGQLDSVKNTNAEADYNRLLGNYYFKKNDLNNAIIHLQLYDQLKDSIERRKGLLMETDINQQLAIYEKQHKIDDLNKDNKLQVIYLYVSTITAIMAAVMISLIYRNWRRSKIDVQTVNILNRQINKQNNILEKALKELNNSGQEKDRILRTVAHDLRNPIGGIASLTSIMAQDNYTEDQKELINLVKDTSVNSLELINEILEATNISSVSLKLEPVEINSLVNNSVELLRFKAAEKNQNIILEHLGRQREIIISREKIWRVISNLISNAIKFSPTRADIWIKLSELEGEVMISVTDNGIGIPDKLKDQIFNMFTSAQRTGTSGEKSFGLGLSICKQIIEMHQGKIWFESTAGKGTTFYISLPVESIPVPNVLAQKTRIPVA